MLLGMGFAARMLPLQEKVLGVLGRWARPSALPRHLQTGLRGEQEAYFFLRRAGYTVVARRWTTAMLRGDLDLVCWDGSTLVVVEVKARTMRDFAPAESAVDAGKRKQLRRMTWAWLRQVPRECRERVPVRFDVVAVYLLAGGVECEHMRDVFALRRPGY